MNRKLNIREIGQLLDRSAAQINKDTLDKLASARRTALQYQQTTQQAPVLAWLAHHGLTHSHSTHNRKVWNFGIAALLALILILLGGGLYWQHAYEHDHSDIDIAILTDDLPVDMYVD